MTFLHPALGNESLTSGVTNSTSVGDIQVMSAGGTMSASSSMVRPGSKLLPRIVTVVPPLTGPWLGVTEVTLAT